MAFVSLVKKAEDFVTELFKKHLPAGMYFHNLQHTQYVLAAATEISLQQNISMQDMLVVQLAAWFHDTGYCYAYKGHEDNSIAIAATFLKQENAADELVENVTGCIAATRMPQHPQNLLQQIICDADMAHLADDDYLAFVARLRREWENRLNIIHADTEWREQNLYLLTHHRYFTTYGQTVLQQRKMDNITKLLAV